MLMHGFPYDIHSYVDVAPQLAAQDAASFVPSFARLRPDPVSRREHTALGRAGGGRCRHDGADGCASYPPRGVRRAMTGAGPRGLRRRRAMAGALHRARLRQFLSDPGSRQRDGAAAAEREVALWYQYYFQLERGRAGLAAKPARGSLRILWTQWSPNWPFGRCLFRANCNGARQSDYVDVVIHSYRHRFGLADGDPHMLTSSAGWRRCLLSPYHGHIGRRRRRRCAGDRWYPPARQSSPAAGFIAWCRAPGTICRRKRLKRLSQR